MPNVKSTSYVVSSLSPEALESIGHGLIATARRLRVAAAENRDIDFTGGLVLTECNEHALSIEGSLNVSIQVADNG